MKNKFVLTGILLLAIMAGFLTPAKVKADAALLFGISAGLPQVIKSTNGALWVTNVGGVGGSSLSSSTAAGDTISTILLNIDGTNFTPTLKSPAAAGNLSIGLYTYKFTVTDVNGETAAGAATPAVTVVDPTVNGKVTVKIPLLQNTTQVTRLNVYRTIAGGSTYKLAATSDTEFSLGDATFLDNKADLSLGVVAPITNTTLGVRYTFVDGAFVPAISTFQGGNFADLSDPTSDTAFGFFFHDALTPTSTAGAFTLSVGNAVGGHGGAATIQAGNSSGSIGGNLNLNAGSGSSTVNGGDVQVQLARDINLFAGRTVTVAGVTSIIETVASTARALWTATALTLKSDMALSWFSTTCCASSIDTGLARSAAAVLKVTNGSSGYGTIDSGETTITTTGAINNLDFTNVATIRMNNASLSTISGFKAGVAGQRVTVVQVGAGQIDFLHLSGLSSAGNQLALTAASGPMSLSFGGYATFYYDVTTGVWRLGLYEQGSYITPGFSAGDYTATSGNWTLTAGDVSTLKYKLKGRELTVIFTLNATTVSAATTTNLIRVIPGGFTAAPGTTWGTFYAVNAGVAEPGPGVVELAADTFMYFFRNGASGAWTVSTDTTQVNGQVTFEVN